MLFPTFNKDMSGSTSPSSSTMSSDSTDEASFFSDTPDFDLFPELEDCTMLSVDYEKESESTLRGLLKDAEISMITSPDLKSDDEVDIAIDSGKDRKWPTPPQGYEISTRSRSNDNAARVIQVIPTPTLSKGFIPQKTSEKSTTEKIHKLEKEAMSNLERKNAINAKINREKKKVYMQSLEGQVTELKAENEQLRKGSNALKEDKATLIEEISYLKNILANQSTLSSLLHNIPTMNGVKLSSSFGHKRVSTDHDHDYPKPSKRISLESTEAGVCLHVKNNSVSLEFCAVCSSQAAGI